MLWMCWDPFGEDFSSGGFIGVCWVRCKSSNFGTFKMPFALDFAECCLLATFLCLRSLYLKIWQIYCRLRVSECQNCTMFLFFKCLLPLSQGRPFSHMNDIPFHVFSKSLVVRQVQFLLIVSLDLKRYLWAVPLRDKILRGEKLLAVKQHIIEEDCHGIPD